MAGHASSPHAITIVDIGGQDSQVILLEDSGDRRSFKMKRKCTAGTGAIPEGNANSLDTPLSAISGTAS